jgi:hypothetical protein
LADLHFLQDVAGEAARGGPLGHVVQGGGPLGPFL